MKQETVLKCIIKDSFEGFPGGTVVKNLPAVQETGVQSLGREDPLQEEIAPIAVFLPGEVHGQRSPAGYSPWDRKRVRHL